MARLVKKEPAVKVGAFAKVNITNNITVRDINIESGQDSQSLPADAVLAKHLFLGKKLIVGTKAGQMTIPLEGKVYDLQARTVHAILIAMHKNGILAPLDEEGDDGELAEPDPIPRR